MMFSNYAASEKGSQAQLVCQCGCEAIRDESVAIFNILTAVTTVIRVRRTVIRVTETILQDIEN